MSKRVVIDWTNRGRQDRLAQKLQSPAEDLQANRVAVASTEKSPFFSPKHLVESLGRSPG